ncbi:MAG: thioredoxin domain-containing protein [Myxococcota bacterium]
MTKTLPLMLPLVALFACKQPAQENEPKSSATGFPPAAPSAPASGAVPVLKDTDVVATVGGQPVLAKEILEKTRAQETKAEADYITKIHNIREGTLREHVLDRLLTEEAKKAGLADSEAYVRAEAEKRRKPLDDARLKALYDKVVPVGGPPFEEVKPQVAQALAQQDMQEAVASIMDEVMQKHQVKWLLPAPKLPKMNVSADDDPVLGNKDAKVTIIEFSDFECPYCARVVETAHAVVKKYDGKVRLVFRDFPLSFHPNAKKAAVAGNCAHEQGKFWPFHDQMFKNQNALDEKALKTYARVAGLDGNAFDKCLTENAAKYEEEIQKDLKDGQVAGVEGTPTFFVNGRPVSGAATMEELSNAVEAALAEAG